MKHSRTAIYSNCTVINTASTQARTLAIRKKRGKQSVNLIRKTRWISLIVVVIFYDPSGIRSVRTEIRGWESILVIFSFGTSIPLSAIHVECKRLIPPPTSSNSVHLAPRASGSSYKFWISGDGSSYIIIHWSRFSSHTVLGRSSLIIAKGPLDRRR